MAETSFEGQHWYVGEDGSTTSRSDETGSDIACRGSDVAIGGSDIAIESSDIAIVGSDVASRGSDVTSRGSDLASRGSDIASRGSEDDILSFGIEERKSARRKGSVHDV